ncbi:DUF4489 domain-containing protein [Clostridium estertheticum]|uniref:DUF4489 domain-containing protein n=1 Tax=Clostridium estertheticum TaxID=238834 RepID=UPI001C0D9A2F|nr:DUF4489 domain-containing protein [Clostridium estertheticum]MBU3217557.1 DUF4489 domain-containing protein [Clostridium estertheticum]WAG55212.1 DUF4489 domain-containing protein [Clostridium estertheticum]
MNSMSKGNWQDEKNCGCKKEKEDKKEEGTKVLLKCKTGIAKTVTVRGAATVAAPVTTNLVEVSINTKHLSDPCIKFEFATNLLAGTTGFADPEAVTLSFQLFKRCKGETVPTAIGNPWLFPSIVAGVTTIIGFIVCDCDCDCDCDDKNDCCTYFMSAITSTNNTTPADFATLLFNNPTLSALVVEKNKRC